MKQRVKDTIANTIDLLSKEQTEIIRIASWLIIPTLLTKFAGQAFYLVIASIYGTSGPISLYFVASALPEMVANILLFGVVGAIIIPFLVEIKEKESRETFVEFYSTIFNIALIVFAVVSIAMILLADSIMPFVLNYLINPNQRPSAADMATIVAMMRVLFLPQILLGASVFIGSGLNAYNRFLLPQLSPLFHRGGMLLGTILFIPITNGSPWAIVAGVIIGSFLHLLLPLPLAWKLGLRIKLRINLDTPYLGKLSKVAIPRLIAFSSEQVAATILTFISFSYNFAFAVVSAYASTIINTVPSLFGSSFAVASYPTMASLYSNKRFLEYSDIIIRTINQILFLSLPFTITLIILRLPTVRLVFGLLSGNFDRESTYMTAWLVLFMGIGVIFVSLRGFLYRIFYAAQNSRIPMVISIFTMTLTVILGILFSNYLSHFDSYAIRYLYWDPSYFASKLDGRAAVAGIGLGASIAGILEMILLLVIFHNSIMRFNWRLLIKTVSNKVLAAGVMAIVMFGMYRMWEGLDALPVDAKPGFSGSTTLNLLVLTIITTTTSFLVYFLMCVVLQIEELRILRRFLNPIFKLGGIQIR